ncbi:MAG: TOMM precursor leader peptide-binding protein [Planctomycetota bacterium]|jgi:bacteriocin biosynthesis cyclodehydratase domain-containing protein
MDEPLRPALRPGIAVIPMPGAVQLRAGDQDIFVLRTDRPGELGALLESLDGTRERGGIMEDLPSEQRTEVGALLDQLRDGALLMDGPRRDLDDVGRYLAHAVEQPADVVRCLREQRVALAGQGDALRILETILDEHGMVTGATPDRADVLVCAWEQPDISLVQDVNRDACRRRVPCLFVDHSHGRHATVGPFFVPGESACYACFRHRLHENTAAWRELIAAETTMERSGRPLSGWGVLPSHRHQVMGLAGAEIVAFFARHRPLRTLNRAVTLDLEGVRAWSEPVWRVPWCPVCGTDP